MKASCAWRHATRTEIGECGTHDVLSISGVIYLADVDRDALAHVM